MCDYLPVASYLPHDAPMVLLDNVIHVGEEHAHCQVMVTSEGVLAPFLNAQGALPAWFGIEIIAQTIGVWSGWHRSQQVDVESKPDPGMLLGGRGYRCQKASFPAQACLDVMIKLLMRDEKIGSFEGEILIDGERVASGRLNTYQPDHVELQKIIQQGKHKDDA